MGYEVCVGKGEGRGGPRGKGERGELGEGKGRWGGRCTRACHVGWVAGGGSSDQGEQSTAAFVRGCWQTSDSEGDVRERKRWEGKKGRVRRGEGGGR